MNKFFCFIFLIFASQLVAQEPMTVIRCTAPELQDPIQNIFVDKENKKWVGNSGGLFQVHAIDFATSINVKPEEQALLKLPNGNNDLTWLKSKMDNILGGQEITAAFYDTKLRELWVGTAESGVIRLKTKPTLQKTGDITNKNSKLKSNKINAIAKGRDGRFWIGTDEGVLVGTPNKWKLEEKFFTIEAISINRGHIWVMGDETVWKVEEGDDFYPIDIDDRMVEGSIRDISADSKGRIWIASDIVSRYNFEEESYQVFGPANYFTSQDVNYIAVDKDDALWVGTQDKGLFLIEKSSAITVTILVDKGLSCDAAQADAALKVKITGGQPPYFYVWNGGLKGDNPKNLAAGKYSLTVTDDDDKTKSAKVEIPDPRFSVSIVQEKEESGSDAADAIAIATISGGGLPDFKYKWDNNETTAKATKLTEGMHKVTVTDQNECTASGSINIGQKLTPLNLSINQTKENKCSGETNAAIEVTVNGGKPPYSYAWDNAELQGATPGNLPFGQYSVTVTDVTGLTSITAISINKTPAIVVTIAIEAPASTENADGKAKANANGGEGSFSYKWDNGETTQTASKLAPNNHSVIVTDGKGCTQTANINITENILPLSISINQTTKINCFSEKSGALSTAVNGGKPPFKYNWSIAGMSGKKPEKLPAGNYGVTLTDATGATTTDEITIQEPKQLTASITVLSAATTDNADGRASIKANGGSGNHQYKWDNNETTKTAKALNPGTHTATITDGSGCTTTASIDINENVLELNVTLNQIKDIDCNGNQNAALSVEVNGGKAPFTYVWSADGLSGQSPANLSAGDYALTLTDATGTTKTANISIADPIKLEASISVQAAATTDNADGKASVKANGGSGAYQYKWDNNEATKTAKTLSPGTHTATITDAVGCTTTASIDINENVLELNVTLNQTKDIDCNGNQNAALSVEVNGGKAPFTYTWNDKNFSGENLNNLSAGDYGLTLTDVTGATKTANISITEPTKIEASISVQQPASTGNADGKAMASTKGGDGKYSFKWDNGETEKTAKKLAPGNHSLTISDGKGCTTIANTEITENILPLSVSINQATEINCFGERTASLNLTPHGGKAPFKFVWNNANAKGDSPTNLGVGDYQVTATDAAGQTKTASITINEPSKLSARITAYENASDATSNDGEAKVAASGGAGNYSYDWDNGNTSETGRKLTIGNHQVVVKDVNGCTATVNVEIKKKIIPELRKGRLAIGQVIRLSELYFDADSTVLNNNAMPILDEITYFLEQNPEISIEIGGHTNGVPPHEYCDKLSSARATSIATYIHGKGINEERVQHKGYGKRKPIASNKTADGRKRNQRVELTILNL